MTSLTAIFQLVTKTNDKNFDESVKVCLFNIKYLGRWNCSIATHLNHSDCENNKKK